MSQSQISFNADGSMRTWDYYPMRARTKLVRLIARLDVPISLGESVVFEEHIKTAQILNMLECLGKPPLETY